VIHCTILSFIAVILQLTPLESRAATLAFPGAEGFGAYAVGGRHGEIRHVTNLHNDGPGSFRAAVANPNGIVVFDVAGVIELKSIVPAASNLTIAGQSAPGEGICITNYEVSFAGQHDDIVRHVRFRVGIATHQDHKYTVALYQSRSMILDHCSISWGGWDCIGLQEASDVTLQYCIIGPGVDPQRFGCLCESDNVTFSHNLWISNQSRNPKAKGTIQYVNNVVYNWGVCGLVGGHSAVDHQLDVVNNYFIKGPDSGNHFTGEYAATDKVYQTGNMVDLNRTGTLEGRAAAAADFAPATVVQSAAIKPNVAVTLDDARTAYEKVVASAGASLHRDSIDQNLIEDVRSLGLRGTILKGATEKDFNITIPPAPAPTNTARDGIADTWKLAHSFSLSDPTLAARLAPDGYTNIEHYLNDLATPAK
jgi:hypothetical protein